MNLVVCYARVWPERVVKVRSWPFIDRDCRFSWLSLLMAVVVRSSADLIVVALEMFWCSWGLGVVDGRHFFDIWNCQQKPVNTPDLEVGGGHEVGYMWPGSFHLPVRWTVSARALEVGDVEKGWYSPGVFHGW